MPAAPTAAAPPSAPGAQAHWADPKRYLWLLSPLLPLLALVNLVTAELTGHYAGLWMAPALLYVLIPLADWLVGADASNPPESAVERLERDRYYRAIVYAYVPAQFAVTALGAHLYATADLRWWEVLPLVIGVGVVNGISINTAHELGHKREGFARWLARLTLAPVAYGHFYVEHNRGHHKNVATPEDPASSRLGESFWAFLPRTVVGSVRSAWNLERERLARLGHPAWHWRNENLQAWAMTVVLFAALTAWLGWVALPFLLVQAAFGAALLEVVNYIEHYGLKRQRSADGRVERCRPEHSWNSNHVVTNLFLYQLQRHADHHANPTRRFQALRHFDDSPQLPSGYASMLLLAYVPPLWFRVMDPLVKAHYRGDLSRANVQPGKAAALARQWGADAAVADLVIRSTPVATDVTAAPAAAARAAALLRHRCPNCDYVYDEARGAPHEGFAPGTPWAALPARWPCPDCAVREKPDFVAVTGRADVAAVA